MELNDLRSEDSIENSNEDERRIVNGNKNTFGTFFEQMRYNINSFDIISLLLLDKLILKFVVYMIFLH
jgi:hypothetical protein